MRAYEKLFKASIEQNIPIQFTYWSNESPYFPDSESPEHSRIVQPVVLGEKNLKGGKIGVFCRAYLLNQYSFSRNKYFSTEVTNNTKKPRYWRLYNIAKMRNVILVKDFDKNKRFYPQQHKEYNPNDKFFTTIKYAMQPVTTYSYYFNGKEESFSQERLLLKFITEKYNVTFLKPVYIYASSEHEEVGFINESNTMINAVWLKQTPYIQLIKGLQALSQKGGRKYGI